MYIPSIPTVKSYVKKLRAKIYCGADQLNTGPKDPMVGPCTMHDYNYIRSNEDTSLSRKEIDRDFLRDMVEVIRVTGKWYLWPKAVVYYTTVRVFGGLFWGPKSLL